MQGVGFRWFARESAQALGVTGWVRNRQDGGVEGEAQGPAKEVEEFVTQLRQGPAFARVDAVETTPRTPVGESAFEIRKGA